LNVIYFGESIGLSAVTLVIHGMYQVRLESLLDWIHAITVDMINESTIMLPPETTISSKGLKLTAVSSSIASNFFIFSILLLILTA